jgi:FkbM family methyltransferase
MPRTRTTTETLDLTLRQKASWCGHLLKALFQQHHMVLRPLLRALVPQDGVIIDAGAHAGQFTKLFADLAPRGHVYAFEPGSYARSLLRRVIAFHRLNRVTLVPLALSDMQGRAELLMPVKKSGALGFGLSHVGHEKGAPAMPVRRESIGLITLDGFVVREGLTRLDFIKADIEGFEVHLLRGAKETLEKFRPGLLVEISTPALARAGRVPDEIFAALPRGYSAVKLSSLDDIPSPTPAPFFIGDGDYLFLPPA